LTTILSVSIPITAPTPNDLLRMHFRARGKLQRKIAVALGWALKEQGWRPGKPLLRAAVRIARYSPMEPDPDGLPGTAKMILDALQPPSERHPYGLGVIADDTRAAVVPSVVHVGRRLRRTDVEIEALP
jgi:hypothetical protein